MRFRFRTLAALTAAGVVASLGVVAVPAAHAGPTILTGAKNSLGQVGSDTTYWMMAGIAPQYNVNTTKNLDGDFVTEVPPLNTAPFPAGALVPDDAANVAPLAGAFLWNSLSSGSGGPCGNGATPPDGSSAGISCLNADTTGQVDFARSSRGPNAGETTTLDFWAYALGALDYVVFPGTHAPANLTQTQLINIYTCDSSGPNVGKPKAANWSQVGGTAGTIVKYKPQAGSGTASFFSSKLLNGAAIDANCDASHQSISLQEHDARGVTAANKVNAIYAFDWARWSAQFKGFEADLRNGSVLGQLNGVTPSPTTVNTTASRFLGTRYVYNVVRKAAHPSTYTNQLLDVTRLIGVRPSLGGSLSRRRVHLRRRSDQGDHERRFRPTRLGCDGRRPSELRLSVESCCAITNRGDGLESRSGGGPGSAPGPPRGADRVRRARPRRMHVLGDDPRRTCCVVHGAGCVAVEHGGSRRAAQLPTVQRRRGRRAPGRLACAGCACTAQLHGTGSRPTSGRAAARGRRRPDEQRRSPRYARRPEGGVLVARPVEQRACGRGRER